MAVISGWYALGTGISNTGSFQECTTYTREAVSFTGTALSGLTQSMTQITGPTGPTGGVITKGAIFDSLTGGNCLMYWDWVTLTAVPANFLAIAVSLTFNTYLTQALNMASLAVAGSAGSLIDQGAQIGVFNGQPLIAGTRLAISPAGSLVAHFGSGQQTSALDVQNIATFGGLCGSVNNAVTATAGSSQTNAAVMWGVINRITTVTTGNDSTILPPLSVAPVGTMLIVINNASANATNLYPDVGSQINAVGANTAMSLAATKSAMFVRVSPILWVTVPLVPS